jgi:hypothetical protein
MIPHALTSPDARVEDHERSSEQAAAVVVTA